jgi:hypothetical protein
MEDQSQKILRKRKPFRLLGNMGKTEIAHFRNFLESSFTNPKPDRKLIQFFDHCQQVNLWDRDIDKKAFEKSTGLELADNAFDKLVSKLYNQLTVFAGVMEFLESTPQHAQFAVRYYEKKGIASEEIGKKVKEGKRELSGAVQDEAYFRMMLELELESAEHSISRTQSSAEERGLLTMHRNLDSYYFILKLRLLCASANEQRIFGDAASEMLGPEMLQWLQSMYPAMPTLARVYYHAFCILCGMDDASHIQAFGIEIRAWEAQAQDSSSTEFVELNSYLLNYYVRKLNSSDSDAVTQAHHFYMEGIRKGWLLENGKLNHEHFKNILTIKCRLQMVSNARAFFEKYKNALIDNLGGAVVEYTEAILEFSEKRYTEVIPKLEFLIESNRSIKTDQYYGLGMRCLLLKTYYEFLGVAGPQAWDLADEKLRSLLHAFPAYIARKNLPRTKQVRFDNFRNTMHRLYNLSYDLPDQERSVKMKELLLDLRSSSNLPDKGWFIQKAEGFVP